MPITITPGERIAQLLFFTTTEEVPDKGEEAEEKYRYPTGPEFSKIRKDSESEVLRRMRAQHPRPSV